MDQDVTLFTKDDTSGDFVEFTPPAFADTLPEDLRESEHLAGIEDAGTLATRYAELAGNQPVVPESADGYQAPEIPEGIPADEQGLADFKAFAHEHKIPQDLFDKIIAFDLERAQRYQGEYEKMQAQAEKEKEQQKEAAGQALRELWGTKYDVEKETASKGIRMALDTFDKPDELEARLKEKGFLDDPDVIQIFNVYGKAVSEDAFVKANHKSTDTTRRSADGTPMLEYPSMQKK